LLIYKFYEYGNFKLDTTFTYLLGSIPFYILGFSNGLKANDAFIKKIIVSYLWVLFIYLLPKIFLVLSSGYFSSDFFISSFVNGGFETSIIFFLPFIAFVTVYGFKLMYDSKLGYVKIMALIILFFNILALFLSSKAGPISMLLFSFVIYYFKRNNKIVKKYGYLLVVSTIIFLFVFGLSSGLFGDLGTLKSKSTAFVNFIESGFILNNEVLDNLTSQRWTADTYSLFQFFNKPLFGNGAYLESVSGMLGESSNFTTASGGHSFVFDTMAYYGVFGLPIIFILFKFSKDGFRYYEIIKNYRFENSKVLLYSSLMSSVFILNILNTGFLFSTFDNFLFLLSGFYLGKLYFKTKLN
jgi:hypothetical protein